MLLSSGIASVPISVIASADDVRKNVSCHLHHSPFSKTKWVIQFLNFLYFTFSTITVFN